MKVLNLDKIIPDDKKIVLSGREFIIPGEVPVRVMLDIMKTSKELEHADSDNDVIEKAFKPLYDVFKIKNEITFDQFTEIISLSHYGRIVNFIINSFGAEEEEKKTEEQGSLIMTKNEAVEGLTS